MVAMVVIYATSIDAKYDVGPTFGKDYAGADYNVTSWNTPSSKSANNYKESAIQCANYCSEDAKCCSWTYCPPGTGFGVEVTQSDANHEDLGERCCLKSNVPAERDAQHWTGLPERATTEDHENVTKQCQAPPPDSCKEVGGKCNEPYPGPEYTHPKLHQSPDCLHIGGWHDMAGALTFKGVHHAFQGCPASQGWSHSTSTDLVHWKDMGRGVHSIHETYQGMDSDNSPCSGFVTVDDDGIPCAGFRQCGSGKGTTGLNPAAKGWDVPMEIRCAKNPTLTNWSDPIWLYPVYYYRALPYDPVRPWKDFDGLWYSAWSTDGCNSTTKKVPCAAGGQLELLVSPALHGERAEWRQLSPMFTTNVTKSGMEEKPGAITREFVTSGYFGGLAGDPDGGKTRVVTQNNGGPTFWVGKQANGSKFEAYWDKVGAVGHYDYGSLTMARTLGSDPNQVSINGRRVLIGWIGGGAPASQSLARDLSLSSSYELLQQFVPELQLLRKSGSQISQVFTGSDEPVKIPHSAGSLQAEIIAKFTWSGANPSSSFGFSVLNGTQDISIDCAGNDPSAPGGCVVNVAGKATGPLMPIGTKSASIHCYVDGEIVETIVNNRTAMVTYSAPKSVDGTAISLFGVGGTITGSISSWALNQANNFGVQP